MAAERFSVGNFGNIGSRVAFKWKEPFTFRLRLRNDMGRRIAFWLACWAGVTGMGLVAYADEADFLGLGKAVATGMAFGLLPAVLLTFVGRKQARGTVFVRDQVIDRHRTYIYLITLWFEKSEWAFEDITRLEIVSSRHTGLPFAVMIIWLGDAAEIVGIPSVVELRSLAEFFNSKGVSVASGRSLPVQFTNKFGMGKLVAAGCVGGLLLLAGVAGFTFEFVKREKMAAQEHQRRAGQNPALAAGNREQSESPPPSQRQTKPNQPLPGTPTAKPAAKPGAAPKTPKTLGRDTELIGGTGGSPFRYVDPAGRAVIGFRYGLGHWAGKAAVSSLKPLYDRAASGEKNTFFASKGYAVAGMEVVAMGQISVVRAVFMRLTPQGDLDPADSYKSDWIGESTTDPPRLIGGTGERVIGVYGRGGAIIDAMGLVLAE